jgi:demethylmenaquinone methyltransferase/2-methoxy-6-polyprenyl-1,4-benzoquinol methylase
VADTTELLREQVHYYRERAPEYDQWFLRQGRYDRGEEFNRRWFAEVEQVAAVLFGLGRLGSVLELAAGTGQWTARLMAQAASVHCVDASPEVLEINRWRVRGGPVTYELADLFAWTPSRRYDTVFFGFWLSHVPAERFESFWTMVETALAPAGRVFFVDSLAHETSTAHNQVLEAGGEVTRRLNDGREFRIVKRFYDPPTLERQLADLGWELTVRNTTTYFIHGAGGRSLHR